MRDTLQVLPDAILINGVTKRSQLSPELVFSNNSAEKFHFTKPIANSDASFDCIRNSSQNFLHQPAHPLKQEHLLNERHSQFKLSSFKKCSFLDPPEDLLSLTQVLQLHEDQVDQGILDV